MIAEAEVKSPLDKRFWFAAAFLATLVIIGYGYCLSGYFLADDTWQVQFAYRVLHGEAHLLFDNFSQSYLSLPALDFYRPLLGVTYLTDYLLYHMNAWGYYLTNCIFAYLAALFFFMSVRALTADFGASRSFYCALSAAALFASSPLHCEDICWISGRADLLAAVFYMPALYLAILSWRSHSAKNSVTLYLWSIFFYVLSLMSKESAVGLPVLVAALPLVCLPGLRTGAAESPAAGTMQESASSANSVNAATSTSVTNSTASTAGSSSRKNKRAKKYNTAGDAGTAAVPPVVDSAAAAKSAEAEKPTVELTKKELFSRWWRFSLPYFLLLIPYFVVRTISLGSPIGGYTGDMGKALSRWLFYRWVDPTTLWRLIFPLPHVIFPDSHVYVQVVVCLYAAIFGLLIVRLVTQRLDWRGLLFVAIMAFQALLPLYKLWGLDQDMHNQRIYYFLTMALALFLPWLVFAPKVADRKAAASNSLALPMGVEALLDAAAAFLFGVIALIFAFVSFAVTASWVDAGTQVKALRARSTELVAANEKPVMVLGIPKGLAAAHILLCGFCFKELFEPPFTDKPISDRLLTFHSCVAGPDEPINTTRFKECLMDPNVVGPFLWSTSKKAYTKIEYDKLVRDFTKLIPLEVSATPVLGKFAPLPGVPGAIMVGTKDGVNCLALHDIKKGGGMLAENLDINPLEADYLSFDIALQPGYTVYTVSAHFDDKDAGSPFEGDAQIVQAIAVEPNKKVPDKDDRDADGNLKMKWVHVNMHVSHFWRWYAHKKIRRMKLAFTEADHLVVKNLRFFSDYDYVPKLAMQGLKRRASGEYVVGKDPIKVWLDSSYIPQSKRMQLVITYVNESFDNFLFFDEHPGSSVEAERLECSHNQGVVEIPSKLYQANGYYEIKARALDERGQPKGDWSDVITIYRPSDKGPAPYYAGN